MYTVFQYIPVNKIHTLDEMPQSSRAFFRPQWRNIPPPSSGQKIEALHSPELLVKVYQMIQQLILKDSNFQGI
jgi:hypothetical protein